jgi:hypothetical protein
MNKVTLHRDGSISFWSVYNQCWTRTVRVSDRELAAMHADDRKRCQRQMARYNAATEAL